MKKESSHQDPLIRMSPSLIRIVDDHGYTARGVEEYLARNLNLSEFDKVARLFFKLCHDHAGDFASKEYCFGTSFDFSQLSVPVHGTWQNAEDRFLSRKYDYRGGVILTTGWKGDSDWIQRFSLQDSFDISDLSWQSGLACGAHLLFERRDIFIGKLAGVERYNGFANTTQKVVVTDYKRFEFYPEPDMDLKVINAIKKCYDLLVEMRNSKNLLLDKHGYPGRMK